MLTPGVAGAAQHPDWLQQTLRDLQRQIDQLRAGLGGVTTNPPPGPLVTAVLIRNMDGTFVPGTTAVGSDFNGVTTDATVTTQSF